MGALAAAVLALTALDTRAAVYHVSTAGSDAAVGTNWGTALQTVTAALSRAVSGDDVWVREGTYYPTHDATNRARSIQLKAGVALYGGFAGGETARDERDWTNHPTILSGNIGDPASATDNCIHVVFGATGARLDGFIVQDGYAGGVGDPGRGAGLYCLGVQPTVANCVFSNHFASGGSSAYGGGAVYWYQNVSAVCTMTWENCVFADNVMSNDTVGVYGAAAHLRFLTNAVVVLSNCVFRGNRALGVNGRGAGLALVDSASRRWSGGAVLITGCVFEANNAGADKGGALYVSGFMPPIRIGGCRFVSNYCPGAAQQGGGAIAVAVPGGGDGLQVSGCRFEGNESTAGGAVYINWGGTNSFWRNCAFVRNMCTNHGGAITGPADGLFEDCSFVSNVARIYRGGAVGFLTAGMQSNVTFLRCTFVGNVATGSQGVGGAMYLGVPALLRDCRFSGSASAAGGALALDPVGVQGTSRVQSCSFENSTATGAGYGGCMRIFSGAVVLTGCRFVSGSAGWYGGGLYAASAAGVTIDSCYFESNRAALYYGGGCCFLTDAVVRASVFVGNSAPNNYGGAVCFRDTGSATGSLVNCVLRGNTAKYGGGVANVNAGAALINCTTYTNVSTTAGYGGAFHASTGYASLIENAVLWDDAPVAIAPSGGVSCTYSCVKGGFPGTGNLGVDPLFADLTFLHLQSTRGAYAGGYFSGGAWLASAGDSPLIDRGNPASAHALEPAPNGGRIDLGAYGNTAVASKSLTSDRIGVMLRVR